MTLNKRRRSEAASYKERGFYDKKSWKDIRRVALQRDKYLCRHCYEKGQLTIANTVHHVLELEDYPELGLDLDNLVSLCQPCHEDTKIKKPEKIYRARVIKI